MENTSPVMEHAVKLAHYDASVYARNMGSARTERALARFFEARLRYHLFDAGLRVLVARLGLRRWPKAHAYELAQAFCNIIFREGGSVSEAELVAAAVRAVERGVDPDLAEAVLEFTCKETLAGFTSGDAARLKECLAGELARTNETGGNND